MADAADRQERLFEAVECNAPRKAADAIRAGADPNGRNENGETPLTVAIQRGVGDPDTVAALLENGADPNLVDGAGWSPWLLNQAMAKDSIMARAQRRITRLLEARGATDPRGDLVGLAAAARAGDVARVERMLAEGIDPSSAPVSLDALHGAADAGHEDVVAVLLAAGMAVDRREEGYFTPLISAAYAGHLGVVKRLVAAGADVMAEVEGMGNAADYAAMDGHGHVVEWLESHGSETEQPITVVTRSTGSSRGDSLGWRLFEAHADLGNGEHSLLFVKAPIEQVSPALAEACESAVLLEGIHVRPQRAHRRALDVYVVQLVDNPWTLVVHGMGSLSSWFWQEGRRLRQALSAAHGWRVIYASENDTDCESWFTVYERGERIDATRKPRIVRDEQILLPGFDPYHEKGLEIIGVDAERLHRVDAVSQRLE